jgi:6-phosphogluconolactonase (cycloisomerase 2 family)
MKSQLRKHLWFSRMVFALSLGLLFLPTGCGNPSTSATPSASSPSIPSAPSSVSVAISPLTGTVAQGGSLSFLATVKGAANTSVTWSVQEGTTGGSITSLGVYTAPNTLGTYHVVATSVADATASASAVVTIELPDPIPTISFLDPGCAPVGAQTLTLAVFGTNFAPGSVIRWNGTDLPTILNGGPLIANIPASDIATAGTATVTVFNPAPGGGVSSPASFNIAAGGAGPTSLAVDPTGKFAYVANEGCPDVFDGSVSMYTINPTDGTLTSAGPPVTSADFGADSVAVDPSGKFAYVANWGEGDTAGSVSMYVINGTTGTLTPTGTIQAPCAPGSGSCAPWSLAVHPSGKFVYVANEGGFTPTSVSLYAVDATNTVLGLIAIIAVDGRAASLTLDPSGKFAYVADGGQNSDGSKGTNVSMYTIDATTGALSSIGKITAGLSPSSIAIHPSGKFVYVVNNDSNDISTYTLNLTSGDLASIGTLAATAGSIVIHPSGKFAYVTSPGSVAMYTIDTTTGALTFAGTTASGSSPGSITIHPSGKFAYGTNHLSNNVSMYSIDSSTGSLTLIGTIGT